MSTTNIYILKLIDNKFYIGYTDNIKKRVQDHIDGNGCTFTKTYKPTSLVKVYENVDPLKVDKYIIKYMKKYGIDNVRGGSYKNVELKTSQIDSLAKEGIIYPKVSKVPKVSKQLKKISIDDINLDDLVIDDIGEKVLKIPIKNANGTCYKCMKDGHYMPQCRETTDKYGNRIEEEEEEEGNALDAFFKYDPMDKR
jgi:predicted GIY-YIG superfamily endonuclease